MNDITEISNSNEQTNSAANVECSGVVIRLSEKEHRIGGYWIGAYADEKIFIRVWVDAGHSLQVNWIREDVPLSYICEFDRLLKQHLRNISNAKLMQINNPIAKGRKKVMIPSVDRRKL